jgi:hypothetical protein
MAFISDRMERRINFIVAVVAILTMPLGTYLHFHPPSDEPESLEASFFECETSGLIIYIGEVKNISEGHAKNVTLAGVLNTEIIDFTTNINDEVKPIFNKPSRGDVRLKIEKLDVGGEFQFNILAEKNTIVIKEFTASWGEKGVTKLKLQQCDKKMQLGVDALSLSKLSGKARQKVLDRNDN